MAAGDLIRQIAAGLRGVWVQGGSPPNESYVEVVTIGDLDPSGALQRGLNMEGTILASAARTTSGQSADITLSNGSMLAVYLDVTAASGTSPTLDVTVKAKDPASGKYFTIGSFAQKTGAASEAVFIGGGADVEFAVRTFRVEYVIGGTSPSFTFSVGYSATV